ncbi:hypothetical protein BrevBR_08245 [Brevundimonas sp. BR2-1]|uniref:hypothetical protein n=1 Tax=Brevundimonas sp. BR2-1 TaxID=3031123 RepID=UPI003097666F
MRLFASRLSITIIAAASLGGCVSVDFKEPVTSFTSTMALSNATLLGYYSELNAFERELYLQRVAENPNLEVLEIGADGQRTGLIAQFSPESIKARTDAIALLSKYGEKLAALAGADAPQRFNAGAQTLGTNLATLDTTFRALKDAPGSSDPTAGDYAGPISVIIGVVGEAVLDHQRDAAIRRAVQEGSPAVNTVLDLLDHDLKTMIGPLQATGQDQALTGLMVAYNRDRHGMSFDQRRAALARIDVAALRYETTVAQQPAALVDGIRDAHAALVVYANSPGKPADLVSLTAALETFNNRVRPLADAVVTLQELDDD